MQLITRAPQGPLGTRPLMIKEIEELLRCVGDDTSANIMYLWNFFYWKSFTYKYFLEVTHHYVPVKREVGYKLVPMKLENPRCFYIGEWPLYWNTKNRLPVSPDIIMTEDIQVMGGSSAIPGTYMSDDEMKLVDEVAKKHGSQAMIKWGNKDRLTPQEKIKYMEKIENPDHTWQDSIFDQIDSDLSSLTTFYKVEDLEDMYTKEFYLRKIEENFKDCKKKEYPEEKPYTYTPPALKDLDKPLTDLELPEPTRNPQPVAMPGQTTYVLNLVMELIPEKALNLSTTISSK